MLSPSHDLLACPSCDAVHQSVILARHEVAHCVACGAVLGRHTSLGIDQLLAITLAAAALFIIASANPLLAIGVRDSHTEATVWSAAFAMMHGWMAWAGAALAITTFLLPLVQIALLLWLLGFARLGRCAPGARTVLRALHGVRPWSMTEVFLLGALVAIIKLSSWVPVHPGIGIWALTSLTLLLTILSMIEPRFWWNLPPRS